MPDIFRPIILRLQDIGAFNFFFPFMLTSAIFYGLLRKSQIFGDPGKNIAVNSVVALAASFMVWAFPVIQGVDIESQLSTFFAQGIFVTLSFMVGLMIFGMMVPNPSETLATLTGSKAGIIITAAIAIGIFVFLTSGLFNLIVPKETLAGIPSDVLLGLGLILLVLVPFFWITGGGEEKKETKAQGK